MADTPTTSGTYRKQGLGDRNDAWGLTNGLNGVFDVLDEAIHGVNPLAIATTNHALSNTSYASNEARQRVHRFTNGGVSANPTVTVPAVDNWWVMANAVTGLGVVVSNGSNSITISDGETAIVMTDGTNVYKFGFTSTYSAPDPGSNGIVVRTASGTTVARSVAVPSAGIAITNANGVSGNPTLALADDLSALEALASTGIAVRTASNTWAQRSIAFPIAGISGTNTDGVSGNPTIALANDLAALENLGVYGIAVRTADDTWTTRTLVAPSAGIAITNLDGITGNPTLALANDLLALENLGTAGMAVRTAADTWNARTITGTAAEITVTDGSGVSANPTLSLPSALTFTGKTVTGGTFQDLTSIIIGATPGTEKLHIYDLAAGSRANGILLQNRSDTAGTEIGIKFITMAQDESDNRFAFYGVKNGDHVWYAANGAAPALIMTLKKAGVLNIANMPTSSAGLSSGDIWANSNVLTIVP